MASEKRLATIGFLKLIMAEALEHCKIEAVVCEELDLLEIVVNSAQKYDAIFAVSESFRPVECTHEITDSENKSLISFHVRINDSLAD